MSESRGILFAGQCDANTPSLWRVGYRAANGKGWLSEPMPIPRAVVVLNRISRRLKRARDRACDRPGVTELQPVTASESQQTCDDPGAITHRAVTALAASHSINEEEEP
jgi:hypothetical protein